jgi:hypothetical protein
MLGMSNANSKVQFLALLIVLLSGVVEAQVTALKRPCFTGRVAKEAISDWKTDNKSLVVIDDEAVYQIKLAITGDPCIAKGGVLVPLADSQGGFVISSYLYELRDRKYAAVGYPSLYHHVKIELGPDDIKALPFNRFSLELGAAEWQDLGELIVDSSPTGAKVEVDGKPQGITKKDLVISKGKHSILVRLANQSCADTIEVKDDPVPYECPKKVPPAKTEPQGQKP